MNVKNFVMDLIEEDGWFCLWHASFRLRGDYDVIALAIDFSSSYADAVNVWKRASPRLQKVIKRPIRPDFALHDDPETIESERKYRVRAGVEDEQGNQIFRDENAMIID